MKRRRYVIAALAVVAFIGSCIWLSTVRSDPASGVAVALMITNNPPGQASFRVFNDSSRAIFLSWAVVEVKTANGWKVIDKREPKDPRVINSGQAMDLLISAPVPGNRWRFKVIYGTESRGPALLLTKIELAIEHRSVSGLGSLGVFSGQSSATTEVAQ